MVYSIRESATVLTLARRLRAQLEALERALEQEKGCAEVLHLLADAHNAMNGLVAEAIQDYIRLHIAGPSHGNQTPSKALKG